MSRQCHKYSDVRNYGSYSVLIRNTDSKEREREVNAPALRDTPTFYGTWAPVAKKFLLGIKLTRQARQNDAELTRSTHMVTLCQKREVCQKNTSLSGYYSISFGVLKSIEGNYGTFPVGGI